MKKLPKEFKYIQASALILAALIFLGVKNINLIKAPAEPGKGESYYVERVVDGDTLKISGSKEGLRLIGLDTPEMHYSNKLLRDSKKSGKDIRTIQALGRRAYEFTKGLCLNKKVHLEFDVVKRDKYNRMLAYVYLEDGTFVNAKIIEEGYAQIMTIPPNVKHAGYFKKLEQEARDGKKGLWKFD